MKELLVRYDNNKCFLSSKVISEGSCDPGDWSSNAENVFAITGINYILKYIQIVIINITILLFTWFLIK